MRNRIQIRKTNFISTCKKNKSRKQILGRQSLRLTKIAGLLLILLISAIVFSAGISAESNNDSIAAAENPAADDATAAPAATFTVNSLADTNDGACTTAANGCTLREAIIAANNSAGADMIQFGLPSNPGVINIGSSGLGALPVITGAVTINGSQGGSTARVELNGASAGAGARGLYVTAGGSTISYLFINRFSSDGIRLETGGGNTVKNCIIGTNSTNTAGIGNGEGLYILNSANNIVGGTSYLSANIVSGNNVDGVRIEGAGATGNTVQGNYIGTTSSGSADLGNAFNGVVIVSASSNTIGNATQGNIISGNNTNGLAMTGTSSNNSVGNNIIGLNFSSDAAIPNSNDGIFITGGATNNTIGGVSDTNGNVISGNAVDGVRVDGATTTGNKVFGNFIGMTRDYSSSFGNGFNGVVITNAPNNFIGAPDASGFRGNWIAGNQKNGIAISGSTATGNLIQQNVNNAFTGNVLNGLIITNSASNNIIGGNTVGERNVFRHNGGDGIYADSGTGNKIINNDIYLNDGLGIDLGTDGVTPNDAGDGDTGANNLQNFPVLTSALARSGGPTNVSGNLNSAPNGNFILQFYTNNDCDSSGYGEAYINLGAFQITTDAGGNAAFNINLDGTNAYAGQYITAIATDASGNSSEISQCRQVTNEPAGALQFYSAAYSVNESNSGVLVRVTRTGGANGTVYVNYSTSNGTATEGQDYTGANGLLTFASGETDKTFTIPIINDTLDEANETFNVTLSNPQGGATIGSPGTTSVTIADDDTAGTVQFSSAVYGVGEAGGEVVITITRTGGAASGVSVDYQTDNGTAVVGLDFTDIFGAVTFGANETSKTFSVPIINDTLDEPDETFSVSLSSPTGGATIGTPNPAVVTIADDDTAGALQFSAANYDFGEAGGAAVITVTRAGGAASGVSVNYATSSGTATAGIDYTATSGTLTFAANETSKSFAVPIISDALDEPNETINLTLSSPTGGATPGNPNQAILTIVDDDPTPSLSINDVSVTEGSAGTVNATFTVSLSAASGQTVSVNFATADGTATAPSDYVAGSGSVTFNAGETSKQISVAVNGDTVVEGNETFSVNLSGATNAVISDAQGIGTIVNDDAGGAIQFSASTATVGEGAGGISLTVTRTGGAASGVSINFGTANGTATGGVDYTATSGTLTFAANETSKTIIVPILEDALVEGNENFTVNLTSPTGGATLGTPASLTVTITDNDTCSYLINPTSQSVPASGASGSVNVTAQGGCAWTASSNAAWISVTGGASGSGGGAVSFSVAVNSGAARTGTITAAGQTFTVTQAGATAQTHKPFDFDGDGKTDISIFRPSAGEWWCLRSSDGQNRAFQFGSSSDKLTPADYTGDGKTDVAFWRPSTGEWFILRSEDNSYYSFPFGTSGDIPIVGDFDADGKADAAVFRPSNSTWYINKSTGGTIIQQFGQTGDVPVVADYDADGKSDIAIYRVSAGEWWINRSSLGLIAFQFGNSTDKPVQGDYTGDGKADVALFRPSTGEWFVLRSENQSYFSFPFGTNGDIPAPGDYDGDGKFDATVFRTSTNIWYSQRTTAGTLIQSFGQSGDKPVPNAFVP
ncbi:MAG TPA: Calx-beta domain-containing protein [Pyrinomonadaceae bacterium]|jgi:CSLREA domain-containing protein